MKRTALIISLLLIPLYAFAKYDHAMIDIYNTGQKNRETGMAGIGAAWYPVYTARTEQRLVYGFVKFDYLSGTQKRNGGGRTLFETGSLLFGAEYERRFGMSNVFLLISLGGGGTLMSAERGRKKGPFNLPDGKRKYDFGPCAEGGAGLMWAPFTRWAFILKCGWHQPVFVRHDGNRTRWGGPFASVGARAVIPGWGL